MVEIQRAQKQTGACDGFSEHRLTVSLPISHFHVDVVDVWMVFRVSCWGGSAFCARRARNDMGRYFSRRSFCFVSNVLVQRRVGLIVHYRQQLKAMLQPCARRIVVAYPQQQGRNVCFFILIGCTSTSAPVVSLAVKTRTPLLSVDRISSTVDDLMRNRTFRD